LLPAVPVTNLAAELLANRDLLSALAGPGIALTVDTDGGAKPVKLTGEDLTRTLVNLVKNAAESMPAGGRIHLALSEQPSTSGAAASVMLAVEDNGPGIPAEEFESIFASGYTTRARSESEGLWPLRHRGLGLAITRSIIEAAGGRIRALNREHGGARFEIELPLRKCNYCPGLRVQAQQ
jgi:signal transduction histidine kinase